MTATSAGSASSCLTSSPSSCLTAKGLGISLAALRRQDPYINNIVDVASQVALYTFNNTTNEWEKTDVEGTLFVYTRLASPLHGFTIMNRLRMENLTEPITKELDFQLQDPFLLYRNARLVIHGIWFYDKQDCQRIAQRMRTLTQQEQALAHQPVDILQMLAKARNEYDKGGQSSSEPKEIGGSSMLCGNLIKPIPVKANAQDGDAREPRSLSLATLFGSQPPTQPSPSSQPGAGPLSPGGPAGTGPSPLATGPPVPSGRKSGSRPAVARSLSYDDPAGAGTDHIQRLFQGQGPASAAPCCSNAPPPLIPALQQPAQPTAVESVACSHPQHNQHVYFSPPPPDAQAPGSQSASAGPAAAPHELLQKLQLVQQEQGQASPEAPRHGPGLAPRFHGAAPIGDPGSASGPGDKEAVHFPAASPQRIPSTVAPTLLLSPSVFSQAKAVPGLPRDGGPVSGQGPRPPASEDARLLSRSQLRDTLLHLIQTDSSFFDSIYKAYVGVHAQDPDSQY
ncbi:hypothetical protein NHX12_020817 [Muraenolepis orangiensis]|uniref:5'-(N(7)-methylguanosine 5'-triphospho)-[mRNA] hydrolase n=1 Tax=Muraenolepis orangiensis TaxID=630683 RepID=A0A9Q0ESN2_9TELE|nr:hypothetical protein NHX12_020817 [Muraenolepis orangiensis]